jgi:hypothetical protein
MVERTSPGLAALFAGLREGGDHRVLDLGPARPAHLRLFSRFAGQIRFVDLIPEGGASGDVLETIRRLPADAGGPYDVVMAWDVLDRLAATERSELIACLGAITAPRARLFFLVGAAGGAFRAPLAFTLVEPSRLLQTETGPPAPAPPELLPAAVERLLVPFEILNAFYVRSGWREYVAARRR